jgi:hypothetical protein
MRVRRGSAATFVLAFRAGETGSTDPDVLAALASIALVDTTVEIPEPPRRSLIVDIAGRMKTWWSSKAPAPPVTIRLLPATFEPSVIHGGVLITVPVPVSAPEGSRVVLSRVSIAGCDVALGEAPLQVIVGFNHAPAPHGPVTAAAEAGDAPALMRLLDGGASTEEKDEASNDGVHHPTLSVMPVPTDRVAASQTR